MKNVELKIKERRLMQHERILQRPNPRYGGGEPIAVEL